MTTTIDDITIVVTNDYMFGLRRRARLTDKEMNRLYKNHLFIKSIQKKIWFYTPFVRWDSKILKGPNFGFFDHSWSNLLKLSQWMLIHEPELIALFQSEQLKRQL